MTPADNTPTPEEVREGLDWLSEAASQLAPGTIHFLQPRARFTARSWQHQVLEALHLRQAPDSIAESCDRAVIETLNGQSTSTAERPTTLTLAHLRERQARFPRPAAAEFEARMAGVGWFSRPRRSLPDTFRGVIHTRVARRLMRAGKAQPFFRLYEFDSRLDREDALIAADPSTVRRALAPAVAPWPFTQHGTPNPAYGHWSRNYELFAGGAGSPMEQIWAVRREARVRRARS